MSKSGKILLCSTCLARSVEFVSRLEGAWRLGTRKSLDPWLLQDSEPSSSLLGERLADSIFHRWQA